MTAAALNGSLLPREKERSTADESPVVKSQVSVCCASLDTRLHFAMTCGIAVKVAEDQLVVLHDNKVPQ